MKEFDNTIEAQDLTTDQREELLGIKGRLNSLNSLLGKTIGAIGTSF